MATRPLAVHTDADPERVAAALETKLLGEAGIDVRGRRCRSEEEVIELASQADVILNGLVPITRRILESVGRCKAVARYGVGYDNVDLEAATEQGIAVIHVPDYCAEEVSNHVMAFLLAWAKQLVPFDSAIHQGEWDHRFVPKVQSVHQQTLGIVGVGRIGIAVADKARAFSMHVVAYDPYVPPEALAERGVESASLEEVLAQSDYVSIHAPLTPATQHLIGVEQLKAMKETAFLINTSRGPVVDEAALVQALQEGWIAGAGLDVFESEPLPADSPLRAMANVVMTPHTASQSPLATIRLRTRIAEEVVRALNGEFPLNVANPAVKAKARLFARN
ncbi:MAG: C-terminal binding protein [Chloroflexi bacterium]|nr:C-terminal binding protein [Chloroflexota bacterium]